MKAIVVHSPGEPEVLQYEEVPNPVVEEGEVLVRVKAVGVNPVDTYIRSGKYPRIPPYPYTPGSDAAGVIEAVGEGVSRFAVGDRVYTGGAAAGLLVGCCAEQVVCREGQVFPLPDNVSYAQGAAVGVPAATAWQALFHKAQARPGETLFIHGASGGVGLAAVQLAVARGIAVAGSAGSEAGLEVVSELGAELVLDHRRPEELERLLDWTGGEGVNTLLEMAAHLNLARDLELLAPRGRLVVIGSRGTLEIDPRATMMRDLTVLGMALPNATPEEMKTLHAALGAALRDGTLRPLVGPQFPLREAPAAHRTLFEPGIYGKVVLIP